MCAFKIITADERMAAPQSIKGAILGPAKIGKTSLLWTMDPASTLFVDMEAGGLSVKGWEGSSIEIRTWEDAKNLACYLGGPNPACRPDEDYSQAHFDYVCQTYGDPASMARFETIFIDSITEAGRLCLHWCGGRPQAVSEKTGKPDTRGQYGLHGQDMIKWLKQLQHIKNKNVWFVGLLDEKVDDFNRTVWQPQIDGSKVGLELPGIVDQVVSMVELKAEDGTSYRAFVCQRLNPWGYPAGDRSGKLDMIEEPHLGKLMAKITGSHATNWQRGLDYDLPQTATN